MVSDAAGSIDCIIRRAGRRLVRRIRRLRVIDFTHDLRPCVGDKGCEGAEDCKPRGGECHRAPATTPKVSGVSSTMSPSDALMRNCRTLPSSSSSLTCCTSWSPSTSISSVNVLFPLLSCVFMDFSLVSLKVMETVLQ
jgi:hypothetical protein